MNPSTDPKDEGQGGLDQRLDEEMRFHLEQQIEKNLRSGLSPAEARRAAHLKFGGVESTREYARAACSRDCCSESSRRIRR